MSNNTFVNPDNTVVSNIQKDKEYWASNMSGEIVKTTFPVSNKKSGQFKNEYAKYHFSFSEELNELVLKLSGTSDQKLHIILVAGLAGLLYKYTSKEDVIIMTPIDKQETGNDFINTNIMLKHRCNSTMSFKNFIMHSRDIVLEAIDHQNYPLKAIFRDFGYEFKDNYNPFSDITLLLEGIHDRSYVNEIGNNIILSFAKKGNKVSCCIEYNSSLYEEKNIENIHNNFTFLFKALLSNVNEPIGNITLLSDKNTEYFKSINQTNVDLPGVESISELIDVQFKENPNEIALIHDYQEVKYLTLEKRVNGLVKYFSESGIKKGDIIGIYLQNSIDTVVAILGVLKYGCVYLPIDPLIPLERVKYIVKDSDTKLLITSQQQMKELMIEIPFTDLASINDCDDLQNINIEPIYKTDPAYVIYTSGSTGNPKGVVICQEALVNYITWAAKTYVGKEKINFPLFSSISFDLTITSIFTPLVTGNTIVIYDNSENENVIKEIVTDNRINIIKLTPSHLKLMINSNLQIWIKENKDNVKLKKLIVGGEDLSVQISSSIHELFDGNIDIYNEYGPTETTVGCIIHKYIKDDNDKVSVPIGKPIDNMKVYILDEENQFVFPGKTGELYLSGKGLAKEYLNKEELTNEKFLYLPHISGERLYKTGDEGFWDEDGNIIFLGRKDQQVKLNGYRVELEEISSWVMQVEGIINAVTIIDKSEFGDRLVVYFTSEKELDTTFIKEKLSEFLPDYMIPEFLQKIVEIPLTRNGKLDRNKLPKPSLSTSVEYVAPSSEIEKKLVEIWSNVLEIEEDEVSVTDTFIELGGHSLKAVFLISRIEKELGIEISLNQLFRYETIERIAQVISIAGNSLENEKELSADDKIMI